MNPIRVYSPDENETKKYRYIIKQVSEQKSADLRTALLLHTSTLAIDTVVSYFNTSLMYPEVLADRLSRIPLAIDDINKYDENTDIKMFLSVVYNDIAPEDRINFLPQSPRGGMRNQIVGNDIQNDPSTIVAVVKSKWIISSVPGVKVIDPNITLCYLQPWQQLFLEIHVRKGSGIEAMKFKPVRLVTINPLPLMLSTDKASKKEYNPFAPLQDYLLEMETLETIDPDILMNQAVTALNEGKVKKMPPIREWR
jgi:hypothetical protein